MNRRQAIASTGPFAHLPPVQLAAHDGPCVSIFDRSKGGEYHSRCAKCGKPIGLETRAAPASELTAPKMEHRFFGGLDDLVVDADARTFEGYGCRFGVKDSYRCVWEPGVFAATLGQWRSEGAWPSMYLSHDWDQLIGAWTDMYEDSKGLVVKGRFIESAWGDHARALVKEKIARGLSIGFVSIDERVENDDDWSKRVRYITKADLYEVSLVERPAVPGSGVSAIRADMSAAEIETVLVRGGFGVEIAKRMVGQLDTAQLAEQLEAKAAAERRAARGRANQDLINLIEGARRTLR